MGTRWLLLPSLIVGGCGSPEIEPVEEPEPVGPTCSEPARGAVVAPFADVTRDSGVDFQYEAFGFQGGGLAVVDLDGDGLPEIVAARRDGGLAAFANLGGLQFVPLADSGLAATDAATAIGAADLDNDGDRDLVIAASGSARVMSNLGDGRFVEAAVFADSGTTEHVLPVDIDGDGLLDLHFSNYNRNDLASTKNRLHLNRGGMRFEEVAIAGSGWSWTASAFDADGDGDQDLYIANDTLLADAGTSEPASTPLPVDLFLRNDGPGPDGAPILTDVAAQLGMATPRSSMGGLVDDFDEDGLLDLFVTDFGANKLFVRTSGGFVNRAGELGLAATWRDNALCQPGSEDEECLVMSWSAARLDFDLDGQDELLVVNGETTPGDTPPVLLFARGPDASYQELSPALPCMDARGLVVTDLDGDGDQDLVIANRQGPLAIFETRGTPAPDRWLHVVLRGRTSNRDGVGAIVTARLTSGRIRTRAVGAGGVIHSAGPAEAMFGIGDDPIDAIEVRWPSGLRTEVTRPATGHTLIVDEVP